LRVLNGGSWAEGSGVFQHIAFRLPAARCRQYMASRYKTSRDRPLVFLFESVLSLQTTMSSRSVSDWDSRDLLRAQQAARCRDYSSNCGVVMSKTVAGCVVGAGAPELEPWPLARYVVPDLYPPQTWSGALGGARNNDKTHTRLACPLWYSLLTPSPATSQP